MRRLFVTSLVALTGALVVRPVVRAQTVADFFSDSRIQEIRIAMNTRDFAAFKRTYLTDTYYPADLTWNGVRVRNVGIRERGSGSRTDIKPGMHVEVDHYTKNQTFLGMPVLDLDNNYADPSFMRERLAMGVIARMGEPTPRESYANVYINNEYYGLYTAIEAYKEPFIQRIFASSEGYLHKFQFTAPFFGTYPGDVLDPYLFMFKAETHKTDSIPTQWGPIRDMFRDANGPDDDTWQGIVDQRLDLMQVMTHVAIESFIAEHDGFAGYAGMNNFFLYRYPGTTRQRLLTWDRDSSFFFLPDISIFNQTDLSVIVSRALRRPTLKTKFLDTLQATAQSVVVNDWLVSEVDRFYNLIAAAAGADPKKQYTVDQFNNEVFTIRTFAAARPANVLSQVAKAR